MTYFASHPCPCMMCGYDLQGQFSSVDTMCGKYICQSCLYVSRDDVSGTNIYDVVCCNKCIMRVFNIITTSTFIKKNRIFYEYLDNKKGHHLYSLIDIFANDRTFVVQKIHPILPLEIANIVGEYMFYNKNDLFFLYHLIHNIMCIMFRSFLVSNSELCKDIIQIVNEYSYGIDDIIY